jgi:hypothetical protein
MHDWNITDRRQLLKASLFALGADLFRLPANADDQKPSEVPSIIGRAELLKGLDGMSRAADEGNDYFVHGHMAAAVISAPFYCQEQRLDGDTQQALLAVMENRLLTNRIYAPRPEEQPDPELVDALVKDLDVGIGGLKRAGHNIIFTVLSLKALRELPEAVTPERMKGLQKMVQSYGTRSGDDERLREEHGFVGLADEKTFIRFALEEYLKAIELYLNGKGHHGFAGHILTIGHALLELRRMGYEDTARKGLPAFWRFVQQARNGVDLGGEKMAAAPKDAPSPLVKDYWAERVGRGGDAAIVSSHLIKYPYSFYALAKEVWDDEELKERLLAKLYYLTAVS